MATPTTFEGQNHIWKGPTEDVDDLPSFYDPERHETISCWRLTDEEMNRVTETGVIWLHVWGGHPPVAVSGECPFIVPEDTDERVGT